MLLTGIEPRSSNPYPSAIPTKPVRLSHAYNYLEQRGVSNMEVALEKYRFSTLAVDFYSRPGRVTAVKAVSRPAADGGEAVRLRPGQRGWKMAVQLNPLCWFP
jgi:hypothetical protein